MTKNRHAHRAPHMLIKDRSSIRCKNSVNPWRVHKVFKERTSFDEA